MTLRLVMPLRTIVDQILMERWKARQPIVHASQDCDCCVALYQRGEGYCGKSMRAFRSQKPLRIHYDKGLSNTERYAVFVRYAYDDNGKGYDVLGNSFDLSESSLASAERYKEQQNLNNYNSSMPSRPVHSLYV
jgi:hypothetical protein